MKFLFVVVLLVFRAVTSLDQLDVEVEHQCMQRCSSQNRSDIGDYTCDIECSNIQQQCEKGCKLWNEALNSSCYKICNGYSERITPKDMYCVMGCNDAIAKYFSQLRLRIGTPQAPVLVADSLNATSLKLEWNFPPEGRRNGLSCYIQWKYEEMSATWQYCRNITWNTDSTIATIFNLQPYTKYRFRVVLVPIHHGEPISSAKSVVIGTLSSGVPESEPLIVRASAVDCTRISVRWEPGPFPHGPLLSYVLQITDNNPQVHAEVKDISPDVNHYLIRNLSPTKVYNISLRMRNGVGLGPPAHVTVATPPEPLIRGTQSPILILGTEHSVIEQGTYIMDEPVVLYETEKQIRGIAVHISKKLLFVSESDGRVAKMSLINKSTTYILTPAEINFKPLHLSIDWLNNLLYILGEVGDEQKEEEMNRRWQIVRCNLDGSALTVAVAGLTTKPHTIEVDPYNGYVFWAVKGIEKGGIYRLDLSDISNGIKHEVRPEMILKDANLGAFTMDHTNFSLLVSMQEENTIYSVSLDGKEIYNTRPRVVKSKMHKIVSLATANKKFYWTDGDSVFYEEYKDDYYHNSYPDLASRSYKRLIINLGSSQPIPIPVNPPINAQAIFGTNEAKTSWNAPHLIGGQGKGAWQNWSYEIAFKDVLTNSILTLKDINTTSCTLKNLKENSKYIVKAAAYTNFGRGPWSKEFVGSTLSNKTEKPFVLWSAAEGLLMSDATGQNVKTLIHGSNMKNFIVTDIAWYKDQIYLVTNNSHMLWYNMTSHRQGKLLESVASIAIDWIGQKLYWSNPKQQMIFRGNLDGTQQEPSISTLAKELNIDSIKAYMYWSTGYAVECAHLNGADKMNYHSAQLFSGKQVMGVTLDMDQKYVYWIVRGSEGSNLFKAVMAGYHSDKIIAKKVASLQKPNMQGPLCYFHKRLLWLQDDRSAAISDLEGQNIATVSGTTMSDLSMVYVVDPTQHIIPDAMSSLDDIVVIPEVIDRNTVTVVGSSESFNISWRPTDNVNYGSVFYEVQIDNLSRNDSTVITSFPSVKYWQTVTPYTKLDVTIRAYTYWGTSAEVRVKIFSPPSTPSAPRNLRSYVMYQANSTDENIVSITFRWDMPLFPNGVIRGFKIYCWCYKNGTKEDICKEAVSRPDKMEYVSKNLMKNETYFFEARAHTNIRDGNMSETLMVNANQETPLPTLLIASTDSIFIQDIDANQNYSLIHGISTPTEMGYLIKENKLFWINQMKELLMLNNMNSNKTKLCDINGEPIGLTVDWLERSLYFAEKFNETSIIKKLNLNLFEKGILKISEIFIRPHVISKLEISPFAKKLYWIEIKNAWTNRLMESNADGSNIRNFFSKLRSKRYISESQSGNMCNCPSNPDIEKTFSVDHSNSTIKPLLIFYDNNAKNIISADKNACICNIIANHSVVGNFLPLRKIKSDFNTLYWTSLKQNFLYALKRQETNVMSKEVSVSDISIFGHHVQPYPPKKCLSPKHITHLKASLKGRTSNSLVLTMPDLFLEDNCAESSVATTEYQICYGEYDDDCFACNNHCKKMVRFSKEIEIVGLKPFLKYNVWISVSNHYTKDEEKVIGGAAIFRTAPGAPSKPLHVSAIVLNPTLAKLHWIPPKEFNGALVYYEIHWQTEVTRNGVRKKEEKPVLEHQTLHNSNKLLTAYLRKLSPNETYTVWVRAYCETNETSSDSDRIRFITYPVPNNLTLLNRTSDSMALSWVISDHVKQSKVQYTPLMLNEWQDIDSYEVEDDGTLFFHLKDLKPKSAYKFRLCLTYENYPDLYIWSPDREFTFETLGDRPSPPGMPVVHYFKPNVYKVWWEASKDNGAPIDLYKLEGMILRHFRSKRSASNNRTAYFYTAPAVEEDVKEWIQLYNGTETSWIIDGLSEDFKYVFRVMSLNSYGWSDPSKDSSEFDLNEAARMADKQTAMTAIVVATSITMTFIFVVVIVITFFACKCTNKKKEPQLIHIPRGPDVELATLRELPRRGVHSTNILYVATQPTPEEIKLLPHIKREQITLTKFLGSGAFGEVFEGKAREMGIHKGDTKVAIKTLRKSASDLEKTEFLQEAQMMSHFKHEHILELLGVCLDNDPHFIIMELMEGGDLLTYLRTSRNPVANTPCLTLIELLKMCVDVSKGCRYLEEMHFVHRDLACRNCLVSSTAPESRIVKIGDFGLARDIYKNDYYRKEGEGLLPVRWMAPESLVDGVFTSQSDVWAFGILLWELMTLGQQPYPARNNLEVLHYVRGGGRLGKPIDCPVELHSLMLKCWEFEPDNRPYFKYCLEVLENLHQQNLRNPRTGAHEGQYISTVPECASWKPDNEEQNKENTPFLDRDNEGTQLKASTSIPKYLELLYAANNSSLENDGYEIPNRMLQTSDTSTSTNNKKYSLNNTECGNVKLDDSNSKSA